jgi:CheY-like chemotaxis protein
MKRHVLVVDDDDGIRQFIQMAFADQGHEVRTAPDGVAALEIVRDWQPHLILLDMRMPVMDGWSFRQAYLKTPRPHAPIIVLTAARDAGASAAEIEAEGFLAKPFDLRELLSLARRLMSPE